jgi:hypothetical protein
LEAPFLRSTLRGDSNLSDAKAKSQPAGMIVGAYADIRRSVRYPRLTALIEREVLRVAFRADVLARNGNQESIGGSFTWGSYPEAFIRLAAWIWYATQWIGDTWSPRSSGFTLTARNFQSQHRITEQEAFERLALLITEEALSDAEETDEGSSDVRETE